MKILILNQVFYPDKVATAQHVFDLAQFLIAEGHQVTVCTGKRDYEDRQKCYPAHEVLNGIQVERLNSTGFGKSSLLGRMADAATFFMALILRLLGFPKYDLVMSFTSPPLIGVLGALFCSLKGGRSLQWLMDVNPDAAFASGVLKKQSLFGRFLSALFRFSLEKSQEVVVLDRFMEQKVRRYLHNHQRVTIVPPWSVVKKNVSGSLSRNPFREAHGLGEKFVVLYSGNHSVVHPLDTLLETALLMKSDPKVSFLFIGKGIRTIEVKNFVGKHELGNCLQLPPQPREALGYSLGAANLHVAVMGKELSGLVHLSKIYGILATGKPFVFIGPKASHVGDLIHDCPSGFIVDHGDFQGLNEVILKAMSLSSEQLEQIAIESIKYLNERFSSEKLFNHFRQSVLSRLSPVSSEASFKQAARH